MRPLQETLQQGSRLRLGSQQVYSITRDPLLANEYAWMGGTAHLQGAGAASCKLDFDRPSTRLRNPTEQLGNLWLLGIGWFVDWGGGARGLQPVDCSPPVSYIRVLTSEYACTGSDKIQQVEQDSVQPFASGWESLHTQGTWPALVSAALMHAYPPAQTERE